LVLEAGVKRAEMHEEMGKMEKALPPGRRIRVTFDIVLPAAATPAEVLEWIQFETRSGLPLRPSNPLSGYDLEAETEPVLTDLG
jgi:hypothetical protein